MWRSYPRSRSEATSPLHDGRLVLLPRHQSAYRLSVEGKAATSCVLSGVLTAADAQMTSLTSAGSVASVRLRRPSTVVSSTSSGLANLPEFGYVVCHWQYSTGGMQCPAVYHADCTVWNALWICSRPHAVSTEPNSVKSLFGAASSSIMQLMIARSASRRH